MSHAAQPYEGWAILELMGHRRRAGRVAEVEMFGGKLLRIDIPAGDGEVTEFYGASSIYSLRPASEEVARRTAAGLGDPRPIQPVEYRLPAPRDDEPDFDTPDLDD